MKTTEVLLVIQVAKKATCVLLNGFDKPIWVKRKHYQKHPLEVGDVVELKVKEPLILNEFWRDVDSRVGMDVCSPFIDRFRGHSFVAYDRGFIWSKTLKKVFLLRNHLPGIGYYPRSRQGRPIAFGADLDFLT